MDPKIFILLFSVVTLVAIAARSLRVPYTVALVLAGLGLGAAHVDSVHLSRELMFGVFLPGLIFEAAFHMRPLRSKRDWAAVVSLAAPGVVVSGAVTAAILVPVVHRFAGIAGFDWLQGALFAAVVAATDPIAVVALFRRLRAPERLTTLVEAESLLNDGTGIVLFNIVVAAVAGTSFTLATAGLEFSRVTGIGTLIGAAVGLGISAAIRRIDEAMIEVTITLVGAYGSFVLAEELGGSGVIACVVTGMLCARIAAAQTGMTEVTRQAVHVFWEYVAFAMNSMVFLLIGMEIDIHALLSVWFPVVAAFAAMTVARVLVVYVVTLLSQRTREAWPWSWAPVLSWSGLRGALSMVLALGIDRADPLRQVLVNMTFGVVLLTIMVQGLTMPWLLRATGAAATSQPEREVPQG